jgi:hypothetical protein
MTSSCFRNVHSWRYVALKTVQLRCASPRKDMNETDNWNHSTQDNISPLEGIVTGNMHNLCIPFCTGTSEKIFWQDEPDIRPSQHVYGWFLDGIRHWTEQWNLIDNATKEFLYHCTDREVMIALPLFCNYIYYYVLTHWSTSQEQEISLEDMPNWNCDVLLPDEVHMVPLAFSTTWRVLLSHQVKHKSSNISRMSFNILIQLSCNFRISFKGYSI